MTALPLPGTLIRSMYATVDVYDYNEKDIVVMTDEKEEEKSSDQWPSKENIVSVF